MSEMTKEEATKLAVDHLGMHTRSGEQMQVNAIRAVAFALLAQVLPSDGSNPDD